MNKNLTGLKDFIKESKTPYHTVAALASRLKKEGFSALEDGSFAVEKGKNYYLTVNDSAIIAFKIPEDLSNAKFLVVASHNDSPSFKLKNAYELTKGSFASLDTEPYGGMISSTWFDRPLSVAGRCFVEKDGSYQSVLVDFDEKNLIIPSVAIHLNRGTQTENKFNLQIDLLPITGKKGTSLKEAIQKKVDGNVLDHDLFLYTKQDLFEVGMNEEYFASPKIDDLECAYSSLEAFLACENKKAIPVYVVFNNEEVGSGSVSGAASTILKDTLEAICEALAINKRAAYANSIMASADNAHGAHPNHPELADALNNPVLNGGIVIKHSASLSYTTDAISGGIFKAILKEAGVPYQDFSNRSDMRGGSTLGHISLSQVSIPTVDIGLAQLAMHSSVETAGTLDLDAMISGLTAFYNANPSIGKEIKVK